jgi:hypothetical protein
MPVNERHPSTKSRDGGREMASCEDGGMYRLAGYITGTREKMKTVPEFPISNLSYARVWLDVQ